MSRQPHESETGNVLDGLPNTVLNELLHLTLVASAASASGGPATEHYARIQQYLDAQGLGHLRVSIEQGQVQLRPAE